MKQRPTRKGKDAEVMGKDSFFAIQKEWQALYERLLFLAKLEARWVHPIEPNEPDTDITVGYSKNPLEPLTIEYRKRKVELTKKLYILFRYINDLYQTEGKSTFEFSDLSLVLTGDECKMSDRAIESLIYRLTVFLEKIRAPFILAFQLEVLYIREKPLSEQQNLDLAAGEEKANRRGQNIAPSRKNATRGNVASHV